MDDNDETGKESISRKSFIKQGIKAIIAHAAQSLTDLPELSTDKDGRLRPPGAIPDEQFLKLCMPFCDACRNVCPRDSIFQDTCGFPYIEPQVSPCVMCIDVSCTKACPTGALVMLNAPHEIRMGLAAIDEAICTAYHGSDCRICHMKCPLQNEAIILAENSLVINFKACTGCGVCAYECPTPGAIIIKQIYS